MTQQVIFTVRTDGRVVQYIGKSYILQPKDKMSFRKDSIKWYQDKIKVLPK